MSMRSMVQRKLSKKNLENQPVEVGPDSIPVFTRNSSLKFPTDSDEALLLIGKTISYFHSMNGILNRDGGSPGFFSSSLFHLVQEDVLENIEKIRELVDSPGRNILFELRKDSGVAIVLEFENFGTFKTVYLSGTVSTSFTFARKT